MPRMIKPMLKLRASISHHLEDRIRDVVNPDFRVFTSGSEIFEIFVGLSGGADSLALLAMINNIFGRWKNVKITAVIIDHDLQENSHKNSENAECEARRLGVTSFIHEKVNVQETGNGLESDARDARYEVFQKLLEGTRNSVLLLGHTLDDQAEQMMMSISRNSGTKALAGIPISRNGIVRPMLGIQGSSVDTGIWRNETEQICENFNVDYWNDPMNQDKDILRVKTRIDVLPELEKIYGNGFKKNLVRTADSLAIDSEIIDEAIDLHYSSYMIDKSTLDLTCFAEESVGVRRGVIKKICSELTDEFISSRHVEAVDSIAMSDKGGLTLNLPGMLVSKKKKTLTFVLL